MRYEDWDVLLFPAGDDPGAHVPIQEFKTACCAVKDSKLEAVETTRAKSVTPLVTSFIPSLPEGAPFQISVHSWKARDFQYEPKPNLNGPGAKQVWQVKVFVDKVCVCIETFPSNMVWPVVIRSASMVRTGSVDDDDNYKSPPLRFPRFYTSILSQTGWDATDMTGRIKVEISEGYVPSARGSKTKFVKLMNHGYFNFQPAPLDILKRAGIAWPNQQMMREAKYPLPTHSSFVPIHMLQSRITSAASANSMLSSPLALPGAPPPTPTMVGSSMPYGKLANSSRSTSAYTTIPFDALPLLRPGAEYATENPPYPNYAFQQAPVRTRLSSDQMDLLISAIRPAQSDGRSARAMPPPPLPVHALTPKEKEELRPPSCLGATFRPIPLGGRRGANSSDVSMHLECPSYPACTSEDESGRVVHNPHPSPASVVRSRKEGSKDLNQRDFLSNLLNPETSSDHSEPEPVAEEPAAESISSSSVSSLAAATTRKRTRSTMKLLNGNEGSPEKLDVDMDKENEVSKPARKLRKRVSAGVDE